MKLNTLEDLLVHELKDLYSAENQLVKALPKMAKGANSDKLRAAFEGHLKETKGHVERLERIFEIMETSAGRQKCKAMEGLIKEGSDMLEEDAEPAVKDAALIGAAQRVEHYEMAGYGTARTFAQLLGMKDVAKLLQQTLDEEGTADKKLTKIAESEVDIEAMSGV